MKILYAEKVNNKIKSKMHLNEAKFNIIEIWYQ